MKWLVVVGGFVICQAWAFAARAETSSGDKAAAEALFEQGKRLMQQKTFAEACPKFQASYQLDPGLGVLLFLADCYERAGKTASAWATFKEAAEVAGRSKDTERERVANVRAVALEPVLAKLLVRVAPEALRIEGLDLRLNGRSVPAAQWGSEVPADPGPQTLQATAPNFERYDLSFEVLPGPSTATVDVPMLKPVAGPASGETDIRASLSDGPSASRDTAGSSSSLALALGGLGVVGLGVGSYLGLAALKKKSDADPSCAGNVCNSEGVRLRDEGLSRATWSTVSFSLGAALLAAGVIIHVSSDSASSAHVSRVELGVTSSGGSHGVVLGGAW